MVSFDGSGRRGSRRAPADYLAKFVFVSTFRRSDSATSRRAAVRKGLDRRWADFLGFWAGLEHFRIRIGLSFLA